MMRRVARMARFGVRSGSVTFARLHGSPANKRFERTGANGRERSLALAMQKVEGSSPFIRSSTAPLDGAFCCLDLQRRHDQIGISAHLCPSNCPVIGLQVRAGQTIAALCRLRVHPEREARVLVA
jgi:hypothetical protein